MHRMQIGCDSVRIYYCSSLFLPDSLNIKGLERSAVQQEAPAWTRCSPLEWVTPDARPKSGRDGFGIDRGDMDVGAIDQQEFRPAADEGQEKVGAAQHDRLGAALAEVAAVLEEDFALLIGDAADGRHR